MSILGCGFLNNLIAIPAWHAKASTAACCTCSCNYIVYTPHVNIHQLHKNPVHWLTMAIHTSIGWYWICLGTNATNLWWNYKQSDKQVDCLNQDYSTLNLSSGQQHWQTVAVQALSPNGCAIHRLQWPNMAQATLCVQLCVSQNTKACAADNGHTQGLRCVCIPPPVLSWKYNCIICFDMQIQLQQPHTKCTQTHKLHYYNCTDACSAKIVWTIWIH